MTPLPRTRTFGRSGRFPRGAGPARRWAIRNRRLLAALCLCAAAGLTVYELTPAPPARVSVLSAAHDLAAGHRLTGADLAVAKVLPATVPEQTFRLADALIGRQLAAPQRRGEILTDAAILGPGLLVGAPPDTVAVPLRVADPGTGQLVRPGERVNVVLSQTADYGPAESEILAANVVVLWTAAGADESGELAGSGWLGAADSDEGLVVVAAEPGDAAPLAGASTRGAVFLVLVAG